jgi:glycosyltransferase involved in cell wall biosynthesis
MSAAALRLAYVVSRYPSISHAFILREVLALRTAGVDVVTFAIRRDGDHELLTPADREEDARTHVLVPASPLDLARSHLAALVRAPGRYLATLRLALAMRGPGARSALWQLFYFAEAGLMWRQCRRRGLRHIHAHHANVGSDVALLASRLGGDGWSWSFTMHGPTELFDVREHRLAEKVELARLVVCISEYARSQLMGLVAPPHWDKLHVVHCGVDLGAVRMRERRDGDRGALEILSVGRLVPVKGHSLLVEALAELRRRGVDARLTIVGDGPRLRELRSLAARLGVDDRVELPGAVGQDAIGGYYARADAFALPSFAEGLPVVLMEAMASGLPVVATHIAGVPELVEDGVAGRLVPPGRADLLAGALERVLTAPVDERRAMGRAGRAKVEAEFDIARIAGELRAVFEDGVAGASARP